MMFTLTYQVNVEPFEKYPFQNQPSSFEMILSFLRKDSEWWKKKHKHSQCDRFMLSFNPWKHTIDLSPHHENQNTEWHLKYTEEPSTDSNKKKLCMVSINVRVCLCHSWSCKWFACDVQRWQLDSVSDLFTFW